MDRIRIETYILYENRGAIIQDIKETTYRKTKKGYLAKDICQMIIASLEEFPEGYLEISTFDEEEEKRCLAMK